MPSPPTFNFLNTVKWRSVSTFKTVDHLSTTDVRSGLREVDSSTSYVIQSNTPHVFIGGGLRVVRPSRTAESKGGKMSFKRINFY